MKNQLRLSQCLVKLNPPNQAITAARLKAFLACAVLTCFSILASASEPTIKQLFSFPCPSQQFTTCPEGYAPDVLIQASDGNFYGAAQLTTMGTSNQIGRAHV